MKESLEQIVEEFIQIHQLGPENVRLLNIIVSLAKAVGHQEAYEKLAEQINQPG